jgi:DtxR family Mn-dependent transcriptional regulator
MEHPPAYQEYCEAVYELHEDEIDAIQARIAERLQVSRPAVSEMMRRLEHDGLVTVDRGRIRLTPSGTEVAERVVRRHRLAERFLTDVLGLGWAEAHVEASKWEHVLSDGVEKALNRLLGAPTTCPHGNPIPGSGYLEPDLVPLMSLSVGDTFVVTRIPEELEFAEGVLEFLEASDVVPGRTGSVTAKSPDGAATVDMGDRGPVGIGPFAAKRILVAAAQVSAA